MLSRITESLDWIGRYVERAEDTARITDVQFHHSLGLGSSAEAIRRRRDHWEALVAIVGDGTLFRALYGEPIEETVPAYLTLDTANPNSVVACIARAREQAHSLRHQIASEMWEALNRFHLDLQAYARSAEPLEIQNAHAFYRSVIDFSHLFQGITDSTMPRDEGWYFLQTGKFLERAEKTARALDVKYHLLVRDASEGGESNGHTQEAVPGDWHQWIAVLRSLSAYEAYHKLYRSAVQPEAVIEMLTYSPIFPRSIRFAIEKVEVALDRISAHRVADSELMATITSPMGLGAASGPDNAERAVGRLRGRLAYGSIEEMFAEGLHAYLLDVQRRCFVIGEHIQAQYFAPRILRQDEVVQ